MLRSSVDYESRLNAFFTPAADTEDSRHRTAPSRSHARCTAFVNGPPRATAGPGALVVVRLTQRSGKPRSHPLPRSRLPGPPWIMYMPDFWSGSP